MRFARAMSGRCGGLRIAARGSRSRLSGRDMGRVRRGFGRFGLAPRTREASSFMRLACQFAIAFCLSFPATGMTTERQEPAEPAPSSAQAQTPPAAKENAPVEQVPPDAPPDSANSQTPSGGEKTGEAAKKQTNS